MKLKNNEEVQKAFQTIVEFLNSHEDFGKHATFSISRHMYDEEKNTWLWQLTTYELEVMIGDTKIKVVNSNKYSVGEEVGFTIDPQNIYCESKTENKQSLIANYDGDNILEGVYITQNQVSFLGADFDTYITIFEKDEPETAILQGVVTSSVFTGVHFELHVLVNGQEVLVHDYQNCEVGQKIGLKVDFFEIHLMKVDSNEAI